jgi:uncharacterized linocin/CFP29 family protein
MDFLMRDEAPLSACEWKAIDDAVVAVARAGLVGRRFIRLYGPLGAGVQAVTVERLGGVTPGVTDTFGDAESGAVMAVSRATVPVALLYKDFRLLWRDVAGSRALCAPLDVAAACAAAAMLARGEDDLVFHGAAGQAGLMNVEGHASVTKAGGWMEPGSALATVAAARQALVGNGAMGPYALALSPDLYAALLRVVGQTGRLELELVQLVADAGVFQTPVLGAGEGVLASVGPDVLDIAVSEDIQVAFLGQASMNLPFRVFESIALRVRRPEGICVLA